MSKEDINLVKLADLISWLENTNMRLPGRYYGFDNSRKVAEGKLIMATRSKTITHIQKLWPELKTNPKGYKGYTR